MTAERIQSISALELDPSDYRKYGEQLAELCLKPDNAAMLLARRFWLAAASYSKPEHAARRLEVVAYHMLTNPGGFDARLWLTTKGKGVVGVSTSFTPAPLRKFNAPLQTFRWVQMVPGVVDTSFIAPPGANVSAWIDQERYYSPSMRNAKLTEMYQEQREGFRSTASWTIEPVATACEGIAACLQEAGFVWNEQPPQLLDDGESNWHRARKCFIFEAPALDIQAGY